VQSRSDDPSIDEQLLHVALEEARAAAQAGDVPIGAVIVDAAGAVLARGRNRREVDQDPTAHAEIDALRAAARVRGDWHMNGCTLYVTLEPCPMCAGALVNARVARLVYGCADPKAGAVDTLFSIGRDPRLNHRFEVTSGVLEAECAALLKSFFAERRKAGPRYTPPGRTPASGPPQADSAQADSAQADSAQADSARADSARADSARADSARADSARAGTELPADKP
jgi:tRNA(adenine34) deaminase